MARSGVSYATSPHISLSGTATWPHLTVKVVRKCSLTMCPRGKGTGFGEQLTSVWNSQKSLFPVFCNFYNKMLKDVELRSSHPLVKTLWSLSLHVKLESALLIQPVRFHMTSHMSTLPILSHAYLLLDDLLQLRWDLSAPLVSQSLFDLGTLHI